MFLFGKKDKKQREEKEEKDSPIKSKSGSSSKNGGGSSKNRNLLANILSPSSSPSKVPTDAYTKKAEKQKSGVIHKTSHKRLSVQKIFAETDSNPPPPNFDVANIYFPALKSSPQKRKSKTSPEGFQQQLASEKENFQAPHTKKSKVVSNQEKRKLELFISDFELQVKSRVAQLREEALEVSNKMRNAADIEIMKMPIHIRQMKLSDFLSESPDTVMKNELNRMLEATPLNPSAQSLRKSLAQSRLHRSTMSSRQSFLTQDSSRASIVGHTPYSKPAFRKQDPVSSDDLLQQLELALSQDSQGGGIKNQLELLLSKCNQNK